MSDHMRRRIEELEEDVEEAKGDGAGLYGEGIHAKLVAMGMSPRPCNHGTLESVDTMLEDLAVALTTARADLAKARGREGALRDVIEAECVLYHDAGVALAAECLDPGPVLLNVAKQFRAILSPATPAPPEPETDGRTDGGCDLFERGPRSPIADCMSDGHYQCVECVELSEEGADIRRANEDDGHLRGGESDLDSPSWTEKEGG